MEQENKMKTKLLKLKSHSFESRNPLTEKQNEDKTI